MRRIDSPPPILKALFGTFIQTRKLSGQEQPYLVPVSKILPTAKTAPYGGAVYTPLLAVKRKPAYILAEYINYRVYSLAIGNSLLETLWWEQRLYLSPRAGRDLWGSHPDLLRREDSVSGYDTSPRTRSRSY